MGCQITRLARQRAHCVPTARLTVSVTDGTAFSYLRRLEFSSPPVRINSVLSDVCTFPRTMYETWFYYFSSLDVQWFINT